MMKKNWMLGAMVVSCAALAAPVENVAQGKGVFASANEANAFVCVDGVRDAKTWIAPCGATLTVDLGKAHKIGSIVLLWGDTFASDYALEVSTDGKSFEKVAQAEKENGNVDGFGFPTREARYVRLSLKKSAATDCALREIEVYEGGEKTNVLPEKRNREQGRIVSKWDFEGASDWREAKNRDLFPKGFMNNYTWGKKDIEIRPCQGHNGGTGIMLNVRGISQGQVQFWTAPWFFSCQKYYRVTFKARAENYAGSLMYSIRRAFLDWTTLVWGGNWGVPLTEEWQEFTFSGRTNTKSDVDNDFGVLLEANQMGRIYIDDVVVEEFDDDPAGLQPIVTNSNPVVKGNLIPNSSVEIRRNKFWTPCISSGNPYLNFADPGFTRVEGGKFGKYCYAIPETSAQGKSQMMSVESLDIPVASGVPYTFSFWYKCEGSVWASCEMKTKKKNGKMARGSGWFATPAKGATNEWRRFTMTTKSPVPDVCDTLQISISKTGLGTLYIDGFQLEVGDKATDYKPAHPYEVEAVVTGGMPNIVPWGKKIPLELSAYAASSNAPATAKIPATLKVTAYPEKVVLEKKVTLETGKIEKMEIDPAQNGIFRVELEIDDPSLAPHFENIAARLPEPRTDVGAESFFGAHVNMRPYFLDYARKIGIKWIRLHDCSPLTKMGFGNPEPDVYRFYDEPIDAALKAGFHLLGMPDWFPKHAMRTKAATDASQAGFTKNESAGGENPVDVAAFSNWCYRVAAHYKGKIDTWELVNEPYMNYFYPGNAKQYAELYEAGMKAVKKANPKAKMVGWCVQFQPDGFASDLPKEKISDIDVFSFHAYFPSPLGGGTMSLKSDLDDMRKKVLTVRDPGAYWNTEGSCGSLSRFYARINNRNSVKSHLAAATYASRMWLEQKKAGIDKYFFYTLHQTDSMRFNGGYKYLIDYDRSITCSAVATAVTAWFIDGLDEKPFTQKEGAVESLFSGKGRTSYAVYDDALYTGAMSFDISKLPSDWLVCDVMGTDLRKMKDKVFKLCSTPIYVCAETTDFDAVFKICQNAIVEK